MAGLNKNRNKHFDKKAAKQKNVSVSKYDS